MTLKNPWLIRNASFLKKKSMSKFFIPTPNGWSHFRCQVKVKNTYWVFYPFDKEVSPKIRALRAITFLDASANGDQKFIAPSKRDFFEKRIAPRRLKKNISKKNFGVEKWKIANRLKRVLPKFHADPSFVRRVNARSKVQKTETKKLFVLIEADGVAHRCGRRVPMV